MDELLSTHREDPRTDFARELRDKLDGAEPARPFSRRLTLAAAGIVLAGTSLGFAPVRSLAREFLDLFRVERLAAVPVAPERVERWRESNLDFRALLGDTARVLKKSDGPRVVSDLASADAVVGFTARTPPGIDPTQVRVRDAESVELIGNTEKLKTILVTLGLGEVTVPENLNGARLTVTLPAAVEVQFVRGGSPLIFRQSRAPEVELPADVDLSRLGEIALRIAGMSEGEAAARARSIDWHSTLLVPLPTNAVSFRDVTVHGVTGLLVSPTRRAVTGPTDDRRLGKSTLLWTRQGMVYVLSGDVDDITLLETANSIAYAGR